MSGVAAGGTAGGRRAAYAQASTQMNAAGTAAYTNAAIADTALRYVGRWGGRACADAHRSGFTGSTASYPHYPFGYSASSPPKPGAKINPNQGGDGQCRSFVNCVVWMASGHSEWLGGEPDGTYFGAFLKAGGTEINNVNDLAKGDIVQIGNGTHTFIIVSHVSGSTFDVVDSNESYDEFVTEHSKAVTLSATERAFRMGEKPVSTLGAHGGAGVVTDEGFVGPLRIDRATAANIRHFAGTPDYVGPGAFRPLIKQFASFIALGYYCSRTTDGLGLPTSQLNPSTGDSVLSGIRCRTVYFLNQRTGRFAAFWSNLQSFKTSSGVRHGMSRTDAVRRASGWDRLDDPPGLELNNPAVSLTIYWTITAQSPTVWHVGNTVDAIDVESTPNPIGLGFV